MTESPRAPRLPGRAHLSTARTRLLTVEPAPGAARVAVRAATTMVVALLTLSAIGRLNLAAYATFGAFTSVYGGRAPTSRRRRSQLVMAGTMIGSVAVGALTAVSADRRWLAVPVVAGCAVAAAAASDRFHWLPPGPVFVVFAVATCASIPTTPAGVGVAVLAATSTAALAVVLGIAETIAHQRHRQPEPRPGSATPLPQRRRRLHAVRCGVAVLLAGAISTGIGIGHPYWAMVASVVPLAVPQLGSQLARGVNRVVGTAFGLALAAGLLALPLPTAVVVLVVAALQGAAELLVARHYGAALVAITPLALLVGQLANAQPVGRLLSDRLLETVIGVAVGLETAAVTRDRRSADRPDQP